MSKKEESPTFIRQAEKTPEGSKELFGRYYGLVANYGEKKLVAYNGLGKDLGRKLIRWETPGVEIKMNTEVFKIMVFTESVSEKEAKAGLPPTLASLGVSLKQKDGNLLQLLILNKEGGFSIWNYCGSSPYVSISQYGKLCDSLEKELARKEVRK